MAATISEGSCYSSPSHQVRPPSDKLNTVNREDNEVKPRPFRFEIASSTHQNYQEVVNNYNLGTLDIVSGLNLLRSKLIDWNKKMISDIFKRKNTLLANLKWCSKINSLEKQPFPHSLGSEACQGVQFGLESRRDSLVSKGQS